MHTSTTHNAECLLLKWMTIHFALATMTKTYIGIQYMCVSCTVCVCLSTRPVHIQGKMTLTETKLKPFLGLTFFYYTIEIFLKIIPKFIVEKTTQTLQRQKRSFKIRLRVRLFLCLCPLFSPLPLSLFVRSDHHIVLDCMHGRTPTRSICSDDGRTDVVRTSDSNVLDRSDVS